MNATLTAPSARVWSAQQIAIFDWFETPSETIRHLIVRARAGTGKTTTICEAVKRAVEDSILVCAFSKAIEVELTKRLAGSNAISKTLHAVGLACVKRFRERLRIDFGSERGDTLADKVCGKTAPDAIKRLVAKLMTKGREIAPHAVTLGDLAALQITFECEPDEMWSASGFDASYVEQKALEAMELASQVKSGDTIDGADMIFLPVRNGWLTRQYDMIVVDEAQDMTVTQLEIALGVLKTGGRICVVGDDRQAIFAFRGADSESLDRLKTELGAAELGLKTTYRCGRAIVELAQSLVPDFEAGPNNPEGLVRSLPMDQLVASAGPGDFVLSRVNAPLVSIAMQLLRAGKRARVAGRDIGAGLTALVRKLKGKSVPDLLAKIATWEAREVARLEILLAKAKNGRRGAIESKIEAVRDQAAMLLSLTDGAKSVNDVEDRVDALFADKSDEGTITCSSVHRSKGLEADRVFVLVETLKSHSQEELNIQYVAYTRAKLELVKVFAPKAA